MALRHTLDQLLVLDAIDRHGTFAKAAASLHRVPSAVSYAVRTLEEQLEVPVFERTGNRAVLTPAGRRLLRAARDVLLEAHRLEQVAQELRDGWEPELQVVLDGVMPLEPFTSALATLTAEGVPTRVRLDVEYQEGVPDRWQADDAALMVLLDFDPEDDPLHIDPLPPLEMALVAAPGHPVHAEPEPDLARHVELVVKDSSPRYARAPKQTFHDSRHVVYLSDFHSKRLAARTGLGFGWLPVHLIAADLRDGTLAPIAGRPNRWTYHPKLVHRSDRPLGRAAQRFRALLLAAAKVQIS